MSRKADEDSTKPESGKRQRRKEDRPREILAAAMEVFAEQGMAAARVEEIAARAGVAKGTVYLYYKTKEELFEAMVRATISPVFSRFDNFSMQDDRSATEMLTFVIDNIYKTLITTNYPSQVMKILIGEGRQFPHLVEFYHREVLSGAVKILDRILRRGIERGEFRPSPILQEPRVLIGPTVMAAIWRMTFDHIAPLDLETYHKAHLEMVLHGLLTRPEPE